MLFLILKIHVYFLLFSIFFCFLWLFFFQLCLLKFYLPKFLSYEETKTNCAQWIPACNNQFESVIWQLTTNSFKWMKQLLEGCHLNLFVSCLAYIFLISKKLLFSYGVLLIFSTSSSIFNILSTSLHGYFNLFIQQEGPICLLLIARLPLFVSYL